ncbi:hypothetical protein A8C56_21360 [Niabella ginsenosidivorans]|uniref:Uncharacterized protein n=1 Tax=Niabella ginsenosidivorans TaxID=1176587 RepID=A0A1A9I687_9BACT|nr:hypothetical protein [Niabella ginsenosidivorans]ANH83188.1 hypothetical protein A8C56_21360 [Niabella ginsenosidivorans]
MNKNKFTKWILLFVLAFITMNMNAQNTGNDGPALNTRQQHIVAISSLTAAGNLDNLKSCLNTGLDTGLTITR